MSLLDFGYRGTLAEDDPFMLALQMQQMQGGDPRQGFASQAPYERPNPLMGTVATPEVTNVAAPVASQPETPQADPLAEYRSVMSREPGFFQENAPLILGLLGGISGLLEATGPSRVPISGGQVFARGLQSGLGGYMGGLKYQQGVESARQQEAANILNALGKEQNIQAALDRRQANNQLRSAIPQMIQDVSGLEGLTGRDKLRISLADRMSQASPEASIKILDEIASRSDQFQFFNLGNGKVAKIDKVAGTIEITSGDGAGSVMNIGTMPYEDAPVKSEDERALFYLQQAPRDSPNYLLAYRIYSQPRFSTSGAILRPNMTALGFLPPIAKGAGQTPSLIDADQTTETKDGARSQVITSDLGTATLTKVEKLKPIPQGEKKGFRDINKTLNSAKRALKLLEQDADGNYIYPGAVDAVGTLDQFKLAEGPEFFETLGLKTSKEGKDLLADIAEITSLTLLERSGAAVTATEFQRAKPFLPLPGDSEGTIKQKLERLVEIYSESINTMVGQYSPEQGYISFDIDIEGTGQGSGKITRQNMKTLEEKFPGLEKIEVKPKEVKEGKPWWLAPR